MGLFSFVSKVGAVASKTSLTIKLKNIIEDCDLGELAIIFRQPACPYNYSQFSLIRPKDKMTSEQIRINQNEIRQWRRETPSIIAYAVVDNIWDAFPEVYSGKFGQRPHDMTTLFIALVEIFKICDQHDKGDIIIEPLKQIGEDIIKNRNFYPFTAMDIELISKYMPAYEPHRPYEYEVCDIEEVYDSSGELCNTRNVYQAIPMEYNWKY